MGEESKPCPIGGVGYLDKLSEQDGFNVVSPDGLTIRYRISSQALLAIEQRPLSDREKDCLKERLKRLRQKGETPPTLVDGDIMGCRKKKE